MAYHLINESRFGQCFALPAYLMPWRPVRLFDAMAARPIPHAIRLSMPWRCWQRHQERQEIRVQQEGPGRLITELGHVITEITELDRGS
jgi:hypothetical protein